MKKTLFSFLLLPLCIWIPKGLLAGNYGMAGCGLGSTLPAWKNDIGQVLAATTNVATSTQTLGITSGTSNCTDDSIVKKEVAKQLFVYHNQVPLTVEFAKGEGERISALASLLGCPTKAKELGRLAQSHLDQLLMGDEDQSAEKLLLNLKKVLLLDPDLNQACSI